MDSSLREISSMIPAQASVEPRASPPNATATPPINCRRVGGFINVLGFFSSLIIVLQSCVFARTHRTTLAEYLQDNLFWGKSNQEPTLERASRVGHPQSLDYNSMVIYRNGII